MSDHLPMVLHTLDHVNTKDLSEPVEKFMERFQSLALTSTTSACRLSTSKVILSDLNNDLPGLDQLLKYKQMLQ
jgi:hypothetical protein